MNFIAYIYYELHKIFQKYCVLSLICGNAESSILRRKIDRFRPLAFALFYQRFVTNVLSRNLLSPSEFIYYPTRYILEDNVLDLKCLNSDKDNNLIIIYAFSQRVFHEFPYSTIFLIIIYGPQEEVSLRVHMHVSNKCRYYLYIVTLYLIEAISSLRSLLT